MGRSARHRSRSARSSFRKAVYRPAGSAQRPWHASPLTAQQEVRGIACACQAPSSEPCKEQPSKPAKKPRKAAAGQKEMLLAISGKKAAKENAAKMTTSKPQRKSA